MSNERKYLGDGVYASTDGYHVILETDCVKIYLDSSVLHALNEYVEELKKQLVKVPE